MRSIKHSFSATAAAVALASLLCSALPGVARAQSGGDVPADLAGLYDAAVKEGGGVVVYSQIVPTTLEKLSQQWRKHFPGVKFEYVRLTTAPLIERVNAEFASGHPVADVVMVSDIVWPEDLYKAGHLAKYDIGSYALWPDQYKRDGYYFVSQLYVSGIMYNPNKVAAADIPKTYQDALKFGRRAIVADPRAGGGNASIMYGTMAMFGNAFWKQAAAENVQYSVSLAEATPQVLNGDALVSINTSSLPACLEAEKKPIKVVYPSQGVWPTPAVTFGTKGAAHPKAAALFLAYLMSEEGQTYINVGDCTYSVRPGVKLNSALPPLTSLNVINISPEDWKQHGAEYRTQAAGAAGMPIN